MKWRPILFSGPMVRALLDGTKTQTRRPMVGRGAHKGSTFGDVRQWSRIAADGTWIGWCEGFATQEKADEATQRVYKGGGVKCPYGVVGDRLWGRETFAQQGANRVVAYRADGECGAWAGDGGGGRLWLRHGGVVAHGIPPRAESWRGGSYGLGKFGGKWKPSIFMPRWASRITLEITDVRVQRLQEISAADCIAEGIDLNGGRAGHDIDIDGGVSSEFATRRYRELWESINGAGAWALNPWVWALTFRRLDGVD